MSEVTHLLAAVERGDAHAAEELLPLVYNELRKLATARMAAEAPGQTLQPTALVHEAYMRLVGGEQPPDWDGRAHFFAAAAEAMRRILIDAARRKDRPKHGGDRVREYSELEIAAPEQSEELLAIDEALHKLTTTSPQAAELVRLRYFAGLSNAETAALLGVSPRKANQIWAYARAWFQEEIGNNAMR